MTIRINDNGVDRDMTKAEVTQYNKMSAQIEADEQAAADERAAREAAQQAALAKLTALGLTEAELNAILGK
jgi:hypothetical protein